MAQTDSAYLEIEVALKNDTSGQFRQELLEMFAREAGALRQRLNEGVPPDEYERLSRLLAAIEAAMQVVNAVWPRLQKAS